MATVEYQVADRVARLTLNRPERDNGIARAPVTELKQAVEGGLCGAGGTDLALGRTSR